MYLNKKKSVFLCVLLSFLCFSFLHAQASNASLIQKYLDKANEALDDGNIDEAYKNINGSLNFCLAGDGFFPANVLTIARTTYIQKLQRLQRKYDELSFIDVKENLEKYPDVNTASIKKLIKQIEAEVAAKEKAQDKKAQQDFMDSLKESTGETQKALEDLGNKMLDQNNQTNENITKMIDQTAKTSEKTQRSITMIFVVIVIIVVVILLVVGLILLIMRLSVKQSQMQQQQYAEAFKLLAQNQSQTNQLMIGGIAGLYSSDGLKLAGSSTWSQSALPEPEDTPEEKEELRNLAAKCEDVGAKIDQVTGRKNNSKNVSEIVFKLANRLGCRQHDAMIYFCSAMVYDAGFLSVSPDLFTAEALTDEQRQELRGHMEHAEEHLQFVPKRYWEVFEQAAKYHHENMDGSGYPEGLKGEEIPQIARIIRVADSYNALSSKRSFRGGMDKESAVEKLEQEAHLYDPDVLQALKDII